jgi:hypothetical protein
MTGVTVTSAYRTWCDARSSAARTSSVLTSAGVRTRSLTVE